MQVLVNTSSKFDWHAGSPVPQFPYRGDVIVATDPGKTNMAMTIGTPDGTVLTILQFRAPGFGNDNSDYCHDFKCFLSEYLKDVNVTVFAIEAAISKQGMNFHRSSMVLTEIRANLIDLSYKLTNRKAFEVNNWAWKYAILPDGMRGQHEKGSSTFLPQVYYTYGNADVTDSICIYKYAVMKVGNPYYRIFPDKVEEPLHTFNPKLVPAGCILLSKARRFNYNTELSLLDNLTYACNRTPERVCAEIPISALTLDDIYRYAMLFKKLDQCSHVEVIALRG